MKIRKSLHVLFIPAAALALSLACMLDIKPAMMVSADPETHSHDGYTAWTSTNSLPSSAGSYYLANNVTISSTWSFSGTMNLCLNGHSITKTGDTGSVATFSGSNTTLNIYDCDTTEHYYYIETIDYLGVVVDSLEAAIAGNPDWYGTFTGGYITGGRGNYIDSHYRGGCMVVQSNATLNLYGGAIIGNMNRASDTGGSVGAIWGKGGHVKVHEGAYVVGNSGFNGGGGIYCQGYNGANGSFTMDGGVVANNTSKRGSSGGGIALFGPSSITGGKIYGNYSTDTVGGGGGVVCSAALDGNNPLIHIGGDVEIYNNRTDGFGGGVCVLGADRGWTIDKGALSISGSPKIYGNTAKHKGETFFADNLCLQNTVNTYYSAGNQFKFKSALTQGANIGVTLDSGAGVILQEWQTYMGNADPADYLFSDNDNYLLRANQAGNPELVDLSTMAAAIVDGSETTYYGTFSNAVADWADGTTLKLLSNISQQVNVASGTKTLDLNNRVISYSSGTPLLVQGTADLTLVDNNQAKTTHYYNLNTSGVASISNDPTDYSFSGGYITGGVADEGRGGGIRVYGSATLRFEGGTVFGNSAGWGGGLFAKDSGEVIMSGDAAIIGNYSSGNYTSGGGVFVEGNSSFTMLGGSIRHNTAQFSGGGFRNSINGEGKYFTMLGGEITGNYSGSNQGNGMVMDMAKTTRIGGSARIYGNQRSDNLYIRNGDILEVVEPFTEDALIYVKMQNVTGAFTTGWSDVMDESAKPSSYFVSEDTNYIIRLANGEAAVAEPHVHSWTYSASGSVITASCDSDDDCYLGDQTLTIVAEGKTYDGDDIVASLQFSDGWTEENGLIIPETDDIVYSGKTVGTHTASITIGEATATAAFDISQYVHTAVQTSADLSSAAAAGLAAEAQVIAEANPTVSDVLLTAKFESKTEESADHAEDIRALAPYSNLKFFDVSLEQNLDGTTAAVEETSNVIEIVLPYVYNDARALVVYSYHGDAAISYTLSESHEDGTYTIDMTYDVLHIYTTKFSTFGVALLHAHEWSYSGSDNVITALCVGEDGCDLQTETLTILADGKTYDGENVVATLQPSDGWTEENGLIVPDDSKIVYTGNGTVGTYEAYIMVNGAKATVSFTIDMRIEDEVELDTDLPGIAVTGLDAESQLVAEENPTANSVKVTMKVEAKTEENAEHAEEIRTAAKYARLQFFEVEVEKNVDGETSTMDQTANVLEIAIPYAYANKRDLAVYSFQGENAVVLERSDSRQEGTFRVDVESGMVYLYVKSFSTFAIAYTPYYNIDINVSLGAYEGTADVMLENIEDSSIAFVQENVAMGKVRFTGVVIGLYRLTITWFDGHANTLTRIISVGGVPLPEAA